MLQQKLNSDRFYINYKFSFQNCKENVHFISYGKYFQVIIYSDQLSFTFVLPATQYNELEKVTSVLTVGIAPWHCSSVAIHSRTTGIQEIFNL